MAKLAKLEGTATYDDDVNDWITFSNEYEEHYATHHEKLVEMDGQTAPDPAVQARLESLSNSLS